MRASGKDDAIVLTTPVKFTLEQAIEFIDDDELVEVTPESIRIRKKLLTENDRKRANRTTTSTSTHYLKTCGNLTALLNKQKANIMFAYLFHD